MTLEYGIMRLGRKVYDLEDLLHEVKNAYNEYQRAKDTYPEFSRKYVEEHISDLDKVEENLQCCLDLLKSIRGVEEA